MTLSNCPWPAAPVQPVLSGADVHIWCASLEQPLDEYSALLSDDELARAQRFRFEQEQRRFVVARGLLRTILGCYLNLSPQKLKFKYGPYGKPELALESSWQRLSFNLSHSGNLVLYAITSELELGIDLEQIHPIPDVQQLAEQFFSALERAELDAQPAQRKLEVFFSGWTRKEAYLKARGDGLVYPLDQFSVAMAPEKPARLLEVKDNPQELARWSLQALSPAPGYVAALAVTGYTGRLEQWQIN
jgi:4'-phosphopantetheinyl transferase